MIPPHHALTAASCPATREFIESFVDQESVKAPSKAIHNRLAVM
jgi:hypothetical protein